MKFEDSNWVKNIKPTCSSLCSLFPMRGHRGQIGHGAARAERLRSSPAAASSVPEPSRARLLVHYAHAFALRLLSPRAIVHAVAVRRHRNAASPPWSAHSCGAHAAPRPCHAGRAPQLRLALLAAASARPTAVWPRRHARHGRRPHLHAEPSTELAPPSTNPRIRLLSSQRSSRARPSPPRLAGTPPQRHSTAAGRRPPWSRRHRPPPRAPRPPTGPRRSPLSPPPRALAAGEPPRRETAAPPPPLFWPARDPIARVKMFQGSICESSFLS
jgi:hypothetical protein